jgi:hypothetical protein
MMDNTRAKLPPVLDVTCGGRMMWFNKRHPLALYLDNREIADVELCDGRISQCVRILWQTLRHCRSQMAASGW